MALTWGRGAGAARGRTADRLRLGGLVLLTLGTIAVIAVRFSGESRLGSGVPLDRGEAVAQVAPLSVPSNADVLFVGDEWTAGVGALSPKAGWPHLTAKALGWDYRIDAVPGSGWANDAPGVAGSRFLDRVEALPPTAGFEPDLVVVSAQMASPVPAAEVGAAMSSTVDALRERLPDAVVVIVLPYGNRRAVERCAPLASDHVLCLDTYGEQWLTEPAQAAYFAPGRVLDNDGHAYFAGRLVTDLRRDLRVG